MTRTWIIRRCIRAKLNSFPLQISRFFFSLAAAASRSLGNDLGTTIKYLEKTTSGAAGIGLGAPGKCNASYRGYSVQARATLTNRNSRFSKK
jgi:phage gp36-like protein